VIDVVDAAQIRGWAFDDATGASPRLIVQLGDDIVGEIVGTEFRPDLRAAGIGDGRHGFTFAVPTAAATAPAILSVRFAEDRVPLTGGELVLLRHTMAAAELFGGIFAFGLWALESLERDGELLVAQGWAVPPFALPIDATILCDGRPSVRIERIARPELARRLRVDEPAHAPFGFRCTFAVPRTSTHAFAFVDGRTQHPFCAHHTVYRASPGDVPLPPGERRRRVAGTADAGFFEAAGSDAFARLDCVLHDYFGTSFERAGAVLDWGCGCGRVARFFSPARREALTGIDIDPENVAWCRENLVPARFEAVAPQPPTRLDAESFDVAFGISVLTHLDEQSQFAWLRELRRVTKPGAAVMVTVHGETAWLVGGTELDRYAEWRARGFLVLGKNHDLDGSPADASGYYNTFTSRRYIYDRWSSYFTILDVLAGGINNYHDLVVMRRD
jgi:SAM-dependent methyltransferase